jgi:hypothetical protein
MSSSYRLQYRRRKPSDGDRRGRWAGAARLLGSQIATLIQALAEIAVDIDRLAVQRTRVREIAGE